MSDTHPGRNSTDDDNKYRKLLGADSPRDTGIQIGLSLLLGLSAFLAFCVLRLRFKDLYGAKHRKPVEIDDEEDDGERLNYSPQENGIKNPLPDLPDTLFGWIWPVWKVTDQQLLASAGLDAYVFLAFFRLAGKFLSVALFFAVVVIKPVHDRFPDKVVGMPGNGTAGGMEIEATSRKGSKAYLWMYVVFGYFFTATAVYLVFTETWRVISVRQGYLGSRRTVADRTIKLTGIPPELRDEKLIADAIEMLNVGKVESVTLCRDWRELDNAVKHRGVVLRKLEEAIAVNHTKRAVERNNETLPLVQPEPPDPAPVVGEVPYERPRPKTTIRAHWWSLRGSQVDAIDYYSEKLRRADSHIRQLRGSEFVATPVAFITLDSVASSQMAIQAVLDPSPLQLIASQSPAPSDVVWENTYLSRRNRMTRSWVITILFVLLTVFWSGIFAPIAGMLTPEAIHKALPSVADFLDEHVIFKSLVTTQLPTLIAALLMILVPYLYYYLSWSQGSMSKGEIEISAISKNFFFIFFNFFVVFTILGTASNYFSYLKRFRETIGDVEKVTYTLTRSLQNLLVFYVNFIILQGLGLLPVRLLELGRVFSYVMGSLGTKTPRDRSELLTLPFFCYSFTLPTSLLVFIISLVYAVLPASWSVLLAGLAYFVIGHFVFKYQLLYSMELQHSADGTAWGMVCNNIFLGLVFFQVTTAGEMVLKRADWWTLGLIPLVVGTVWTAVVFRRCYAPLLEHIALRSVTEGEGYSDLGRRDGNDGRDAPRRLGSEEYLVGEGNVWADEGIDEPRGREYVNPSLVGELRGPKGL